MHKVETKVMNNSAAAGIKKVMLEGNPQEEVHQFCYLGSMADRKGVTEADIPIMPEEEMLGLIYTT